VAYVTVDNQYIKPFIEVDEIKAENERISTAHHHLHNKTGRGNDYLGWIDYPETYDKSEFSNIQQVASEIQQHSDILVVIGVGGSYLGARAAIELLSHSFYNELPKDQRPYPRIIFAGNHLSGKYIKHLFDLLENESFSVNVISKSGSTIETAIAFRLLKQYMAERYDKEEMKKRTFITTDKVNGPLKQIATEEGYTSFSIPDDIGGRYSVLTAVGLLPIAVSGLSIEQMMQGAQLAREETMNVNPLQNPSYLYATLRHLLYKQGKKIEMFNAFEPRWQYFQEWWKQLYGESEGKDGKGVFPAAATFTTDLHSLGQYIQDGERHLYQTILFVEHVQSDMNIPREANDYDKLNYLANKSLHELNENACVGTITAHTSGEVPTILIRVPEVNAFSFGYLVYFFQKSCALSSYLLDVNPFDQPGVEAYKQNMMALLKSE